MDAMPMTRRSEECWEEEDGGGEGVDVLEGKRREFLRGGVSVPPRGVLLFNTRVDVDSPRKMVWRLVSMVI